MGAINQREINEQFLSHIGYLALIGVKGPYRQYNLHEFINNVKVIDNPAEVAAGDIAYGGNRLGTVVSNVLNAGKRTITVKYGPIERPAGVTPEEWAADYDALAFQTDKHVISDVAATNATGNVIPNPYLRLASISVVFARKTDSIPNPAENDDIALLTAAVVITQGGPATSLKFNIPGVTVQKRVANVNSGAPVTADASGVASVPNGNTTGQSITFLVTKEGYSSKLLGPYVVVAP